MTRSRIPSNTFVFVVFLEKFDMNFTNKKVDFLAFVWGNYFKTITRTHFLKSLFQMADIFHQQVLKVSKTQKKVSNERTIQDGNWL